MQSVGDSGNVSGYCCSVRVGQNDTAFPHEKYGILEVGLTTGDSNLESLAVESVVVMSFWLPRLLGWARLHPAEV